MVTAKSYTVASWAHDDLPPRWVQDKKVKALARVLDFLP
jgi:hypothetical protein